MSVLATTADELASQADAVWLVFVFMLAGAGLMALASEAWRRFAQWWNDGADRDDFNLMAGDLDRAREALASNATARDPYRVPPVTGSPAPGRVVPLTARPGAPTFPSLFSTVDVTGSGGGLPPHTEHAGTGLTAGRSSEGKGAAASAP